MKANELMIGDWVMRKQCFGENANLITDVYRVDAITKEDLYLREEDKGYISKYYNPEIVPIPLDSDILNKNFPDTRYGVYWCWDDYRSENTGETWYEIRIVKDGEETTIGLRYVHEFQHLLRLCGIEKEIEL